MDEAQLDPYPFTFMAHSFSGTGVAFFVSRRIHEGAAVEIIRIRGTRLAQRYVERLPTGHVIAALLPTAARSVRRWLFYLGGLV